MWRRQNPYARFLKEKTWNLKSILTTMKSKLLALAATNLKPNPPWKKKTSTSKFAQTAILSTLANKKLWTPQVAWTNSIKNTAICSNALFNHGHKGSLKTGELVFRLPFYERWIGSLKTLALKRGLLLFSPSRIGAPFNRKKEIPWLPNRKNCSF